PGSGEAAIAVAEQDTHGASVPVGHGEVGRAVAVEVPNHQKVNVASSVASGGLEGAIALAHQYSYAAVVIVPRSLGVTHGQVETSVGIEAPHRDRDGTIEGVIPACPESAVPLAQQDKHAAIRRRILKT